MLAAIHRSESSLLHEKTKRYFGDIYDHAIRIIEGIESHRDLIGGMLDIYLSSLSNKMNETMKPIIKTLLRERLIIENDTQIFYDKVNIKNNDFLKTFSLAFSKFDFQKKFFHPRFQSEIVLKKLWNGTDECFFVFLSNVKKKKKRYHTHIYSIILTLSI